MDKDRLDWIENAAIENMKAHHLTADVLAKEAAVTLTVLLAGVAGSLAYTAKAIESHSWTWLTFGATGFTVWLFLVSWYLVKQCMLIRPLPQIYNEPRNMDFEEYSFEYLRQSELLGIQIRIDDSVKRHDRVASCLNRSRMAMVASPAAFIFTSVVAAVALGC